MDKTAYLQLVKKHAERRIKPLRLHIDVEVGVKLAIRKLVEQYVSCSEMDGLPRWEFNQAILKRAHEACISDICTRNPTDILPTAANYNTALELTSDILKAVFKILPRWR